ncbi:MAG: nucleotidyltransferase, partial [Coleofasciculus sp. C3-bin4]|nr:nucleotidyltransferase [Coleofasciculus sp. C3-bin4]
MKLTEHFDDFLKDTVNLNQSRIEQLEKRVETISSFLCKNDYAPRIWRFTAQGSWAHKSIIKPPKNKDFDADLLAIIGEVEGWRAKDYINELYYVFRNNQIYADKVSRGTRCVVLNYKGDFHLDVVPCIQVIEGESKRFWVCNRCEDEPEETASESYTAWLAEKNSITGRNQLQKVIRLLKYLRDIKETFSVKSILLTTLVGMQIDDEVFSSNYFSDLPTSLKNIVNWLDDFLQARPCMPVIENPVLSGEHFNRHWNQEKYKNFRSKIHQYRQWIDDAYAEL